MPRRLKFIVAAILLATVVLLSWRPLGIPPVPLLLRYGPTGGGGPTGRILTVEGVEFAEIRPGFFRMGSHQDCTEGDLIGRLSQPLGLSYGEWPEHNGVGCPPRWVEIRSSFWIATTEVTNEAYERFDPEHERSETSPGGRHPAVNVSWNDARKYCEWLSERVGHSCRLPSEAEWEYCCRAGSRDAYCFGDETAGLPEYAWFEQNSDERAHEIALLLPNAWGLFDLHGNVCEWVEDHWCDNYRDAPADERPRYSTDPEPYPTAPKCRVLRGGSFWSGSEGCRAGRSGGWLGLIEFISNGNSISPGTAQGRSSVNRKSPLLELGSSDFYWEDIPPIVTAGLLDDSVGFRPTLRQGPTGLDIPSD